MSKLNRIAAFLAQVSASEQLPREYAECVQGVRSEIAGLWLTDRSRGSKPDVGDETRTGLFLVDNIFWDTLPRVAADLQAALNEFYPGPWYRRLGFSWVRGLAEIGTGIRR